MDVTAVIQATLLLFAIVNPVGSIPLFLQLTEKMSVEARQKTFRTGVGTSAIILFVFLVAGKWILQNLFQIGLNDLTAAGGLLLLIIAIDHLIFGALAKQVIHDQDQHAHHVGAVPIACPILAGPGAMMTVFVSYSEYGLAVAAVSIVIVLIITWLILRYIEVIYRLLGEIVCLVLSKILCLFLAAIGIHLLMQGLAPYLK